MVFSYFSSGRPGRSTVSLLPLFTSKPIAAAYSLSTQNMAVNLRPSSDKPQPKDANAEDADVKAEEADTMKTKANCLL